ncbi:unnamed protein product [Caenorhabditis bovis]|uniref:Sodium/calcium exchanger membrane region domain-containing protein n=1 Tax=Caenorhabditis bovis TaxID=2654633 RepID=A0A8S1E3X9_9PELO|nr:unnamed protein product [Caenorhabditis bovis]
MVKWVCQETRRARTIISITLFSCSLIILAIFSLIYRQHNYENSSTRLQRYTRHTRNVEYEFDDCRPRIPAGATSNSSQFPEDFMSLSTRRHGGVIVHILLLIYMFVALAVVCDEFFVPSLSVITEVLSISDDVAGATFMAAGGSAPEFFTSLFGVFIAQDNVGVGTIVGSATFNILCVLAFCTLFSRQVLHLTWWPLFRDMSFYTVSLFLLLIFFKDEVIEWYEAFVMFLMYIAYGVFMKYNSALEIKVKMFLLRNFSIGNQQIQTTITINERIDGTPNIPESADGYEPRRSFPMLHGGQEVRKSIAQLVMGDEDESATSIPTSASSSRTSARSENHNTKLAPSVNVIMVKPAKQENDDEFVKQNNITTTASILNIGGSQNGEKNKDNVTPVEVNPAVSNGLSSTGNKISPVPPIMLDNLSIASSSAEQPLDLSWPESGLKKVIFVLLVPITFPLAYTLPDVRKQSRRKYFAITFCGAILWIAAYSYLMVWWANTIGETFGIPTEIMGLTILAAGTSIPDLITSVIVARKGLGDMAVSSSIGSNLFDVCVGLPVPWLIHFVIAYFKNSHSNISVTSNGLACSLGLLFAMLLVLLACVAISKWKMDKFFGLLMIFSYAAFCMLCILLETGHLKCPLRNSC